MAKLRVFIASTCYDLNILRSELRPFILNIGYEPVMSDYSDILYDPRSHTHDSCLKEISGCDVMILVVGSRFGGTAVPTATAGIDFTALEQLSTKTSLLEEMKDKLSITQLEVLKAVEHGIPLYVFVDEKVLHDHHVYEKNKEKKDIIDNIEFPSIQKHETAKYIFEFINFLSHRVTNNSITSFARLDEIKSHLTSQWSQLFQRLLYENRTNAHEATRYRDFSESIEDLKAVVLASLGGTPSLRETAKGVIQYRQMVRLLSNLNFDDLRKTLLSKCSWETVMKKAHIKEFRNAYVGTQPGVCIILDNGKFYRTPYHISIFENFPADWANFNKLEIHAREAIVDTLLEDNETRRFPMIKYIDKNIDEYLSKQGSSIKMESATDGMIIAG